MGWFAVNLVVLFAVNQVPPDSRPIGGAAEIVANIAIAIGLAVSAGVFFTVGEFAMVQAPPVGLLVWGLGINFIPIAAWFAVRAIYRRIE